MSRRIDRVNELLRLEISQVLARQIKDPRLSGVITITEVRTSSDLRNALVLLSVMGDKEAKQSALAGIQSAAKFLRRELRGRLTLRYTPFLSFALDDSLENAARLLSIMDQIQAGQDGGASDQISPVEDSQISPASANSG
ncbi:MAG: 30S ribosome-binding factor RbfA [Chloroflexi bacterium]|nr:30S ribosome-binding factor RbfA [Chloroflexota bacterium]